MRRLNRSFAILAGIVGTLVMAFRATRHAYPEGADEDATRRGGSPPTSEGDLETSAGRLPRVSVASRAEPLSARLPMRSPRHHFLFWPSSDPFGFATPLGTLSAIRLPEKAHLGS